MNNVHNAGVLGWIKQLNVPFPHSQAGKPSVCCSFSKHLAGVSIPLNSDNWLVSENKVCKESTAVTGKEVHGSCFILHPTTLPSHFCRTSAISGSPLPQAAALAKISFDP
jgi:hypothetical protein